MSERSTVIVRARDFAVRFHRHQSFGEGASFSRVERVVRNVTRFGVVDPELIAAAWLHDILEPASISLGEIRAIFGDRIARLCDAVSSPKSGSPENTFQMLGAKLRETAGAEVVKFAERISEVEVALRLQDLDQLSIYRSEHPLFQSRMPQTESSMGQRTYLDQLIRLDRFPVSFEWLFHCSICQSLAGETRLIPPHSILPEAQLVGGDAWVWSIECFGGSSQRALSNEEAEGVKTAMETKEFERLVDAGPWFEWLPFHCRECDLSYCQTHWKTSVVYDDGFYDQTLGVCPKGHRTILDD